MESSRTHQSEQLGYGRCGLLGDIACADMTPRLRDLCRVVEFVKVSYWDPGAEALLAI